MALRRGDIAMEIIVCVPFYGQVGRCRCGFHCNNTFHARPLLPQTRFVLCFFSPRHGVVNFLITELASALESALASAASLFFLRWTSLPRPELFSW